MRLLLDQCTPLGLTKILAVHDVVRAAAMGWAEVSNGDLIAAAEEAGFDVLVTSDHSIRYQQNLTGRQIALVVLLTNNWPVLQAGTTAIIEAVNGTRPGSYQEVAFPRPRLRRRPYP